MARAEVTGIHPTALVGAESIGTGATVGEFAVVRSGARIGDRAVIHPHVVIEENVEIGDEVEVLPGCHIGRVPRKIGVMLHERDFRRYVSIGDRCSIGANAVIYYDTEIGPDTLIGDGASVRELSRIGSRCVLGRGATLGASCSLGDGTRVHEKAHLSAETRVGKGVFISNLVVTTNDNTFGDPDAPLLGPTIEDGAKIGAGASILPGVVIGESAIVGSGAVVTKDVDPRALVQGVPARPVNG